MSWINKVDKQTRSVLLQEAAAKQQPTQPTVVDPLITERISYINDRAPWIPANTQLSLAKNYASDAAVDKAAELYGRNLIDNPASAQDLYGKARKYYTSDKTQEAIKSVAEGKPVDRSFFEFGDVGVYGGLKQATRFMGALGAAVPEALQTVFSLGTLGTEEGRQRSYSVKDALDSFSIVQLLKNWDDQGEGFYISEQLIAQQSEAARKTRGMVRGSAFTLGRGTAASMHIPNGLAFNMVSGLIDFIITANAADPNKYLIRGARAATSVGLNLKSGIRNTETLQEAIDFAKGVVPLVTKQEAAAYRAALQSEAGLTKSLDGLSLDVKKFNRFMDVNPAAVKAVKEIADTSDPLEIAKKFQWRLTNESIERLAAAKTVDAVKGELINNYAIGANTLTNKIQDIQVGLLNKPAEWFMQKTPLKNSRLLSQLPSNQIVINGTDADRTAAVKNMYLSLKTAGAKEERLKKFVSEALANFKATSSADDQRVAYNVYKRYLKDTLELNGVKNEVIQAVFNRAAKNRDKLRQYMLDRAGNETDNGYMKTMGEMLKKHFPQSVWDEMMEKSAEVGDNPMQFARPMQLSQLFDRVQTLPDPRELRRLTSNPFMLDVLNKAGKQGKLTKPVFSKFRKMEIEEILDPKRYQEIQDLLKGMPTKNLDDATKKAKAALQNEQNLLVKTSVKRVYTGEQALWIDIIDGIQNVIWKPLNLATIGYILRNSIDAQVRMSLGGASGFLNHPGEYISLLLGETKATNKLFNLAKKYDLSTRERSILGETLVVQGPKLFGKDKEEQNIEIREAWKKIRSDHADLFNFSARKQGLNTSSHASHTHSTGDFRVVSKTDGNQQFAEGVLDSLRLAHQDELQKTAAQLLVFGADEEQLLKRMTNVANQRDVYKELNGIYKRGVSFKDKSGTTINGPAVFMDQMTPKDRTEWLRMHAKDVSLVNVKNMTGEIPEAVFIAAFDRVPNGDRITLDISKIRLKNSNETLKPGSFVVFPDKSEGIVIGIDGSRGVSVQPIFKGSATGQETFKYHREAIRLINNMPVDIKGTGQGLATTYIKEMLSTEKTDKKKLFVAAQNRLDDFTDFFFQQLYGEKWVKTLERSPVFRKFYYDEIGNQIGKLKTDQAEKLIKKLENSAKNAGFGDDIGKYIGSPETATKLRQIAATPGVGTLNASDLDDYARLVGISKTKELLYDASNKNNLEDVTRIIFPFAGAWREIAGQYLGFMLEDPSRMGKAARYANTLKQTDLDNDGRGFIYEDPQTQDFFFKSPVIFGFDTALRAAGVKSFFEAPVSQLSQGMSWIPGIGPLAQIPVSFILRNQPERDTIVKALLPYGKVGLSKQEVLGQFNPLPGVANKTLSLLYSLIDNNSIEINTAFAGTLQEVTRANFASGDFDITTEEGFKVLEKASLRDARTITLIKIAQQFFGPTSPQVGFQISVDNKDVYVDEMVKVFTKMQEEDYDTAVPRFLKVFGDDAALYIGSKTSVEIPGLEASGEFGEWELKNQDLLKEHPKVAAYFGPAGEFNFDVYNRQKSQGKRRTLSIREMTALAQKRIGSAKYRAARKMFGAFPTEAESQKLRAYREKLHKDYPGFPVVAEFTVGEFDNQLIELEGLVNDPRLANNEITPTLVQYLNARKQLMLSNNLKSFKSKKARQYAETLYTFGNRLAEQNPQFDRIWQRLLSSEVED